MKKILLSGITAVALMAAHPAFAGGLGIFGETGLARTPLAMTLAPMQFAFAVDYVASDNYQVPLRAEVGLPYGFEVGGFYNYLDTDFDINIWSLNAKWLLPPFVQNLGLAVGGHYAQEDIENLDTDGYDLYAVASYSFPVGEGLSLIPSFGVSYISASIDEDFADNIDGDVDGVKFFGSLILKAQKFAIGAEFISTDEDLDGEDADASYWFGGRYFVNPMITLQAGYLNNTNFSEDPAEDPTDGVFHLGAQFAFGPYK
jgi:hypothetical protein